MNEPVISSSAPATYTPGYVPHKRVMVAVSVAISVLGFAQLWTPLRLVLWGERTRAEATRVVKEKPGLPPAVLTDDHQIQAQVESRDRSFIFWNEFRFHTADGRVVELRANIGSQLKPLYPLTDADGLPTTALVCYRPADPQTAIFPLLIGTWLAPAMLVLGGLAGAIVGGVLLYWASKPIALPHITVADNSPPGGSSEK